VHDSARRDHSHSADCTPQDCPRLTPRAKWLTHPSRGHVSPRSIIVSAHTEVLLPLRASRNAANAHRRTARTDWTSPASPALRRAH
jgi:hypothetical protein